jgi:hypothetical protein
MGKQVTLTYSITYDLREGEVADEYREQLNDYEDTASQRAWFAIDRFIGHDNLALFDKQATLIVTEEK